ncbi:hypothetical protein PWT90_03529 [Aphanocladium album]|nr:hypothetical protein PWT90_03529 [Aphanocladium album]
MGSDATTNIVLIPWDAYSDAHADRMTAQRHACGWDADKLPSWRKKVAAGDKLLFWIVLAGDEAPALLAKHVAACEYERAPLRDSAARVGRTERSPTEEAFLPIGHISLEEYPARNVLFGLPAATLWIKTFYISKAIQAGGLGRKAMGQVETMAAAPPFSSAALALDTTDPAWQLRMVSRDLYGTDEPPAGAPAIRTNQAWYLRQDYVDMALPAADEEEKCARLEGRDSLGYYGWTNPETDEFIKIPTVYMYKMLDGA